MLLIAMINGDTWSHESNLKNVKKMREQDEHSCMFIFQESTGLFLVLTSTFTYSPKTPKYVFLASRGGHYSIGRQLNITDGVLLTDLDEYDQMVIQKIEHSSSCGACRRLFSTLTFDRKLLKQNVFTGLVAELLKTLASSFCRSKFNRTKY